MSVDRYGINKNDIGPLAKASFEETERILLRAAIFGEVDPITGVSANIMMGQAIRGGTSFSQVLLDEYALMRLMKGLPAVAATIEEEEEGPSQREIDELLYVNPDDPCAAVQTRMNAILPPAMVTSEKEDDIQIQYMDEEEED
jgi:DNA-directed RNA polymerase II subunit RPB1